MTNKENSLCQNYLTTIIFTKIIIGICNQQSELHELWGKKNIKRLLCSFRKLINMPSVFSQIIGMPRRKQKNKGKNGSRESFVERTFSHWKLFPGLQTSVQPLHPHQLLPTPRMRVQIRMHVAQCVILMYDFLVLPGLVPKSFDVSCLYKNSGWRWKHEIFSLSMSRFVKSNNLVPYMMMSWIGKHEYLRAPLFCSSPSPPSGNCQVREWMVTKIHIVNKSY